MWKKMFQKTQDTRGMGHFVDRSTHITCTDTSRDEMHPEPEMDYTADWHICEYTKRHLGVQDKNTVSQISTRGRRSGEHIKRPEKIKNYLLGKMLLKRSM
jgi:hypothetical protein